MVWALRAGSYLVTVLLIASLVLVAMGLAMAARPEVFAPLGFRDTAKIGMVFALAGGVGGIGSVLLSWVLKLVRGTLADQED